MKDTKSDSAVPNTPGDGFILAMVAAASVDKEFSDKESEYIKMKVNELFSSDTAEEQILNALEVWQNTSTNECILAAFKSIKLVTQRKYLFLSIVDLMFIDGTLNKSEIQMVDFICEKIDFSIAFKKIINDICTIKSSDDLNGASWS